MKRIISLALMLSMALGLPACAKEGSGDTAPEAAPLTTAGATDAPDPLANTETTLCLTKIVTEHEGVEQIYNITYEEDGVHVTPEKLANTCASVYDPNGSILSQLTYNEDGVNAKHTTYTYDDAGLLTGQFDWDTEDGSLGNQYTYTYNEQGKLVKLVYENHGYIFHSTEYVYDTNGFLLVKYYYGENGVLHQRFEYTTNSNGQLQSCNAYKLLNDDESLREWGTYTYIYDPAGHLLSKHWEQRDALLGTPESNNYTYDKNGDVTSSSREYGKPVFIKTYAYDENGYLVRLVDEDGTTITFVYAEVVLAEAQAQMAHIWSKDGIKMAFVATPEH